MMIPRSRTSVAVALLIAFVAVAHMPSPSAAASIPLKVLVLTSPGFTSIDFLETVMQGYGAPYDIVRVDTSSSPPLNVTTLLWGPNGITPQYGGIISYPNLEAMGYFNASDVQTFWAYQRINGVRTVKFGAWPTNFGYNVDVSACTSNDVPVVFSAGASLGAVSGVKPSTSLSTAGLYRCPGIKASPLTVCPIWAADFAATGLAPACTPSPFMEFSGTGYVSAILSSFADGRESLGFVHDCAAWSTSCVVLGHQALAWLLHDAIPGERRALLTVQTDDVFLATEYDLNFGPAAPGNATQYRLTAADLQAHVTWLSGVNSRLAAGSNVRIELPFNGQGVLEMVANTMTTLGLNPSGRVLSIDDRGCLDLPDYKNLTCTCWFTGTATCPTTEDIFCRNCTKDWRKPAGYGTNRAPSNALTSSSSWNLSQITTYDDLAAAVVANTNGIASNKFFWSHHTWSHENLDNVTSYDTNVQIVLNQRMARLLGLSGRASFSSKCMITPQISGLQNADALTRLAANGLSCATGDNTWPFLINQANVHQMLDAPVYPSFKIMPRWACEIYYNCSTTDQNMFLYNNLYSSYYGGDSTFDQLLQREATRVVRDGLLKLRKDPFMMHQANLALTEGTGSSLLMRWVDAVLAEYGRYVSWPVKSLKIDDLRGVYLARQQRDNCQLSYTLDVGNGTVNSVTVSSGGGAGNCSAPILTAAGQTYITFPAGGSASVPPPSGLGWGLVYV